MSGGVGALTVLVNGLPAGEAGTEPPAPDRRRPGPGFVRLTVMGSRGTRTQWSYEFSRTTANLLSGPVFQRMACRDGRDFRPSNSAAKATQPGL